MSALSRLGTALWLSGTGAVIGSALHTTLGAKAAVVIGLGLTVTGLVALAWSQRRQPNATDSEQHRPRNNEQDAAEVVSAGMPFGRLNDSTEAVDDSRDLHVGVVNKLAHPDQHQSGPEGYERAVLNGGSGRDDGDAGSNGGTVPLVGDLLQQVAHSSSPSKFPTSR